MSFNQSIKLYESLKQLPKMQFDEVCFYLQKEYNYDLSLIPLDKVPLADSAMQLINLLEQINEGLNHLQEVLEKLKEREQTTVPHLGHIIINPHGKWLLIGILVVSVIGLFIWISRNPSPPISPPPSLTAITQTGNNATIGPVHTGDGDININYPGITPYRFQQLSEVSQGDFSNA